MCIRDRAWPGPSCGEGLAVAAALKMCGQNLAFWCILDKKLWPMLQITGDETYICCDRRCLELLSMWLWSTSAHHSKQQCYACTVYQSDIYRTAEFLCVWSLFTATFSVKFQQISTKFDVWYPYTLMMVMVVSSAALKQILRCYIADISWMFHVENTQRCVARYTNSWWMVLPASKVIFVS